MRRLTLIACIVFCAGVASAQSLGDVARAEKERKAKATQKRVLSNEDLQREHILPAPQETPALPRMTSTPPASDVAQPSWSQQDAPGFSLGDHARAMRQQKDAASTAQAQNEPPAPPALPNLRPAWTAAEQPGFSLGEHARRIRAERARRAAEAMLADNGLPKDARAVAPQPVANLPAPSPAPAPKRDVPPPARPTPRTALSVPSRIVVHRGDSLWKISRKYLGEGRLWIALWTANPELKNPDLIHPGQTLRFPAQDDIAQARITRYSVRAAKSAAARNQSVVRKAASQKKLTAATTSSVQPQPTEVTFTSRVIAGQTVIVPVEKKTRAP